MTMGTQFDYIDILSHFALDGEPKSCFRYGEGHINDTFKVTMQEAGREKHYILQRINHNLFRDVEKLMHNIELVTSFCRESVIKRGGDPLRECLTLIRTKGDAAYYFDGANYFRVYVFIEGAT